LTLRGAACLAEADVVVYDYLAGTEIVSRAPKGCEMIYVGKQAGRHSVPQDRINSILVDKAKQGKKVVRLKGGDPFVFGRGGEEAEVLFDNGIPFEVVPGVTSAIAAPAYAGIPVTHRSHSSGFCVVTGHEDPKKDASTIAWKSLASGGSTLVFLMGVKQLPAITKNLLDCGMDRATPTALVRWGGTPLQETLSAKLCDIAQEAAERGVKPPAVLVVGSVVDLREKLAWYESRPLFGVTVLVTRAAEQAGRLSRMLREHGASPFELPVIAFSEPGETAPLDAAIEVLSEYAWLVFTSANGVRWFLKRVYELGGDVRSLAGPQVAAIGPATKRELEDRGIRVEGIPSNYVAEGLVEYFSRKDIRGGKVLVARAQEARPVLIRELEKMGASVDEVACYRTVPSGADPAPAAEALASGRISVIAFTSSSTVLRTLDVLEGKVPSDVLKRTPVACIGPVTAETAGERGLNVVVEAEEYTIEGLVDAIVGYFSGRRKGGRVPGDA
jgi:uroporphyrinogen III methyltransferase/synthase